MLAPHQAWVVSVASPSQAGARVTVENGPFEHLQSADAPCLEAATKPKRRAKKPRHGLMNSFMQGLRSWYPHSRFQSARMAQTPSLPEALPGRVFSDR